MKGDKSIIELIRDERGAALTEFVIVIPIVLLFFLAMIQYLQVFRASQLGNYAAYSAARVYAVCASVDGPEAATDKAMDAAALALAPVARLVPGEIFGFGGGFSSGGSPAALAEGFMAARYIRLNPDIGGGSLKITTTGSPKQVNVELNYPQPIFISGLAELWGLVGGGGNIRNDLKDMSQGLGGMAGGFSRGQSYLAGLFPGLAEPIGNQIQKLGTRLPYVNVRSKCSMGYEDWGRKNSELYAKYQPRLPSTVTDSQQDLADKLVESSSMATSEATHKFDDALKLEQQSCAASSASQTQLGQAQQAYNMAPGDPATVDALNRARQKEQSDRAAYEQARKSRMDTQSILESATGKSYGEPVCSP